MKYIKVRRGFTLIELVVTIAIISILATGLVIAINPAARIQQAHDTQRKNDLEEMQQALQMYYQDYGHYPFNDSNYQICVGTDQVGCTSIAWDSAWTPYIQKLPKDPSGFTYRYVSANGEQYQLYAHIEQYEMDEHTCTSRQDDPCSGATTFYCGPSNATCNYGVSSPNVSP